MKTYLASTAALLCFALTASMAASAQTGPAASAGDASAAPAGPPKVAVIAFQAAVGQTNEFQRNFADLQKKYEPKRQELKTLSDSIEALQKTLQTQSATLNDETREKDSREIAEKQKQLQRDQEDDQNSFQQDMQDTFNGVASKVGDVLIAYAQEHGYTLVLDGGDQQTQMVLYASPATDITKAILDAYNTKSGVPAPVAGQPATAPARPRAPAQRPAAPQH
ncbi:MAG TPA: OmpH family outer membrane protein [Terracidiphilus sp.]|jgi:outer membrane protein|nr:OmpH family outer membrane protein [Terracidiphilus sp.]